MNRESDYKEFIDIMNILGAAFNRKMNELLYKAYWQSLRDIDIGSFKRSAESVLKTSRFFPTIADLRNEPSAKDRALLAWEAVIKGVQLYGYYESVKFQDPIIHSVIRAMGGWKMVSASELNNYDQKTFCDFYAAFSNSNGEKSSEHIKGFHEEYNEIENFPEHITKAKLIKCDYLSSKELKRLEAGNGKEQSNGKD